jgi:two-component system sensor histidine kinase/response regulator
MSSPSNVKILVVDDVEDNVHALTALLRRDAVEFLTATSGDEALELLLVHDVALAILDVQMPEMDGFELAELMRGSERTRHVPIIFVTAGSRDVQHVFRGYEVGAVDFLFKPIDPVLLGHKVTTFVALHRERLAR